MINPKDKLAVRSEGAGTGMGVGKGTLGISVVTGFSLSWVIGTGVHCFVVLCALPIL